MGTQSKAVAQKVFFFFFFFFDNPIVQWGGGIWTLDVSIGNTSMLVELQGSWQNLFFVGKYNSHTQTG